MIYIPTITSKVKGEYESVLYSPNKKHPEIIMGKNITIWDNYTFYLYKRYRKPDKHEIARDHYIWLIEFIKDNWKKGITLITPDVDWLRYSKEIEELWRINCFNYPQLYVPNSWKSDISNLNIVGYALRKESENIEHPTWTHCLGHIRNNLNSKIKTYDSVCPKT